MQRESLTTLTPQQLNEVCGGSLIQLPELTPVPLPAPAPGKLPKDKKDDLIVIEPDITPLG